MKGKDIAKKYQIDQFDFWDFLRDRQLDYKTITSLSGISYSVDDNYIEKYVRIYKEEWLPITIEIAAENYRAEVAEREAVNAEIQSKKKAMAEMLITSGFTFDGYTITKYSGYISGDDVVQIPRSGIFKNNDNGQNLTNALVQIRRQALKELKEAAYNLGCNAVIGVDFDYLTLEPETANFGGGTTYEPYVICVTANGNAVVIEKNQTNLNQAFSQQGNK
ncbi:MAG: heavy metal-binding domain-containing protein [Ruminococcus sp.]|nr:heavy metal-binding domain-containing protein [Ruminococcus sp.]